MKKTVFSLILFFCGIILFAQGTFQREWPENYIQTNLTLDQLKNLSSVFSVDKVIRKSDGTADVRFCVGRDEYDAFENTGVPFELATTPKANVSMANSYSDLVANWNKYPTYSTYIDAMQTFQTQFPDLCKIDTILSNTPGNHALLVAHISNNLNNREGKPSFFYTSTMHGDEPVGYYLMLHLIHYLLNNYTTDGYVRYLVDNVDIWICPLENPDGTYHTNNNTLNESPVSTRYNANYVDMNRSYPIAGQNNTGGDYEPEVQAMMNFGSARHFTMSANFHGGAEVFNYPWDTWASNQHKHADDEWWKYVGHQFADTCQSVTPYYMTDQNDGVTEGGDWYVITGSRQDYYNYFLSCREVTIEVSSSKVVNSSKLPNYWNRTYRSLLNYIGESLNGISGVITDSITGAPLEAQVYVESHDIYNSQISSQLPYGDYHRPIKAGTYQVTYTADGYCPKSFTLTAVDGQCLTQDVQLVRNDVSVRESERSNLVLYPNPLKDLFTIICDDLVKRVEICDVTGKCVFSQNVDNTKVTVNLSYCKTGCYFVRIYTNKGIITEKIVKQ